LYATENHGLFIWISPLAQGLYFIGLLILCAPSLRLGSFGAGLAISIPYLVSFPFVLLRTKKLYGIQIQKSVFWITMLGLLMGGLAFSLRTLQSGFFWDLLWSILALAVYLALSWTFKISNKDDFRYFKALINPIQFYKVAKSEFLVRETL
jgi:hypothetical protein